MEFIPAPLDKTRATHCFGKGGESWVLERLFECLREEAVDFQIVPLSWSCSHRPPASSPGAYPGCCRSASRQPAAPCYP